eukprot:scaffold264939_cov14-Tisochrysis_lutea.AAC.1
MIWSPKAGVKATARSEGVREQAALAIFKMSMLGHIHGALCFTQLAFLTKKLPAENLKLRCQAGHAYVGLLQGWPTAGTVKS